MGQGPVSAADPRWRRGTAVAHRRAVGRAVGVHVGQRLIFPNQAYSAYWASS